MNRKKITALALTAALSAVVLAGCGSSAASSSAAPTADSAAATADTAAVDQLAQIKERGTITIAMEGTWAPWTYHDE
ncbi:MAG: amino acid ABC transporter substrate-binding protein, partial [Subdoligranulum variabile]|nr:amino acid ABC transporter substrate-binding protein [Subdoligranulum variabile]